MATNKNAQFRYQILDRCFSNFHRRYEIDDLWDEVNEQLDDMFGKKVSVRQIREEKIEENLKKYLSGKNDCTDNV